jgi:hypothetical protein
MRRESFEIEGYKHGGNPIPAVTRIGNLVLTGGISGIDTGTGTMPATLEDQCANMFGLDSKVLKAANAKLEVPLNFVSQNSFWPNPVFHLATSCNV